MWPILRKAAADNVRFERKLSMAQDGERVRVHQFKPRRLGIKNSCLAEVANFLSPEVQVSGRALVG